MCVLFAVGVQTLSNSRQFGVLTIKLLGKDMSNAMGVGQRKLVGHGAIVMFIALAAGFGLIISLIGGLEVLPGLIVNFNIPGDTSAWARAHVGGIMNGLLMIVIAVVIWAMQLPRRPAKQLTWMALGTGYANTMFYWGGLLSPSRALTMGDNRLGESNIWGVLGFLPALIFAVILMVAMVILMRHAFSTHRN